MKRSKQNVNDDTYRHESRAPVVAIPREEYERIKSIRPFSAAIGVVRLKMKAGGLNYSRPFASWVNAAGDLCHQNFDDARYYHHRARKAA